MRSLFARTVPLLFGAGETIGGVKKVVVSKIDYSTWALQPPTRLLLDPIHHPLVVEYFLRLHERDLAIQKWQETAPAGKENALTNKVDGSPFDMVRWNTNYRDELDLASKLATVLKELDDTVVLQTQMEQKKKDKTLSDTDAELLEMAQEDVGAIVEKVHELDDAVRVLMERRLRSEDVVGSSSKTWTCTVTGKAGGEEAGLFAGELAEMFKTYAKEFREMRVSRAEEGEQDGGGAAGAGEASTFGTYKFQLTGDDVYRNFHHEIGVHKVQRVPVTDAVGKMQTSTAVFTMMPVLDPVAVNVHESDCKIDFVRGSGPGGQGMQSSSNCVVLTHKPTGISVKCHQSRSALGNKELALQMVAQQILAQKVKEQHSSLHEAWSNQWSSGERSDKMRTYNFPQNRVTDHRLGKDYSLSSFMERGSGLVGLHDELNDINDREQLCSVLLKHIKNEFGSTV